MLLKALRISQNGPPGAIFEATGERARMLIQNKIAETYQPAEDIDPDADLLDDPVGREVKGGPKAKDAASKVKNKTK